jgi:ankyrin repeat protein
MEQLIQAGANIDAYSRNKFHACPLQSAAAASQLEAARVLLTKGASPNCRGDGGYSPLHEAAGSGQLELARLLLQHKADVSAKGDDGKTALDVASEEKQGAILELLKKEAK